MNPGSFKFEVYWFIPAKKDRKWFARSYKRSSCGRSGFEKVQLFGRGFCVR